MKKAFTLIELLVVMVIVGLMVTMALAKYKSAIEKGRGLQGVSDAAAISDAVNAYYIKKMNNYGDSWHALCVYATGDTECYTGSSIQGVAPVTAAKYFTYTISLDGSTVTVQASRSLGAKSYAISFVNQNGEVTERYCTGYQHYCQGLGAVTARTGGGWKF